MTSCFRWFGPVEGLADKELAVSVPFFDMMKRVITMHSNNAWTAPQRGVEALYTSEDRVDGAALAWRSKLWMGERRKNALLNVREE